MSWTGRQNKGSAAGVTLDDIREKIKARLRFFEDELRKRGYNLVVSAEQEFFVLDKDGWLFTEDWPGLNNKRELESHLRKDIPLLDYCHEEEPPGEFEIVISSKGKSLPYPSIEVAKQTEELRAILHERLHAIKHEIAGVSFSPRYERSRATRPATAGMHISFSLWDAQGRNLFYDEKPPYGGFSDLATSCSKRLLTLQQQGVVMYVPTDQHYKRIGAHMNAPSHFSVSSGKGDHSIATRTTTHKSATTIPTPDQHYSDNYRLEDRLAGADINPYLVMLADIGSVYQTVMARETTAGTICTSPTSCPI